MPFDSSVLDWTNRVRPVWASVGEVVLPASEGKLGVDGRHRLWREVARRLLAKTLYRGPLWMTEGIADAMGEEGAGGRGAVVTACRRWLTDAVEKKKDGIDVGPVLRATNRRDFFQHGGRAIGWALVRLFLLVNPDYLHGLVEQNRRLAGRLAEIPEDPDAVTREFTEIALAALNETGATNRNLGEALTAWVGAGFPTGPELRKSKAYRLLLYLDVPEPYTVRIKARWWTKKLPRGPKPMVVESRRRFVGAFSWRFPWPVERRVHLGAMKKRPTVLTLDPGDWPDATYRSDPARKSEPIGKRQLLPTKALDPTRRGNVEWLLVTIRSPDKLGYAFLCLCR
jgi:hypothetical protein